MGSTPMATGGVISFICDTDKRNGSQSELTEIKVMMTSEGDHPSIETTFELAQGGKTGGALGDALLALQR